MVPSASRISCSIVPGPSGCAALAGSRAIAASESPRFTLVKHAKVRLEQRESETSYVSTANFCLTDIHKLNRFARVERERGSIAVGPRSPRLASADDRAAGRDRRHRLHRPRPRPLRAARRRPARRRRRLLAERARAAAAEIGAERAFASAEELVASDEIDVVHVCTPNHLHLPLARAALEAGKHVVCEKPVALDAAGAAELARGRRARRPGGDGAVRLPLLPDRARGPRAAPAPARSASCGCSTAATSRTGCWRRRTTTGGSSPTSAAPRGPSPTSARTGAT